MPENPGTGPKITAETKRYLPWLVAVALFMENLGVEPLSLKTVLTSYTLCLAVFIPISGWMTDRFGTRRVFASAITLFMLGSLACGLAPNVPMLVAARIIQGIGGAMMTPVGRTALVRTFPRSEMLTAMNFVTIPALIGPLMGPFLGGVIVHWLHWRVIFFINLPVALTGLWLQKRHMPEFREDRTPPLDRIGFLLFGSGVALISYVLEIFSEHTLSIPAMGMMLAVAVALLCGYAWHARRIAAPVLALVLLRIRTFRLSVAGGFVTRLGFGGMPFLLPLLYQIGMGFLPWQAGLLTMPQAVSAIGMKVLSKPLLARFGHRSVLIVNTVFLGLTMTVFTRIGPGTAVWQILVLSFCQGFFSSIQFSSMNSLTYADVADRDASKASSIASTAQQMSLSFGVASASLITAWFLGHVDQTNPLQAVPALHKAFCAMGIMTVVSSLTFWGLRPGDGANVSNYRPARAQDSALKPI